MVKRLAMLASPEKELGETKKIHGVHPKGVNSVKEKELTFEELCELSKSSQELADLFGLTVRHINRLAQDGVLLRQSDGRFNLVVNVRLYLTHLKKH
ncbi:hypothetical protein H5T51_06390 [Candidatus Bathyarchaeota archaeon]|nr:hypothetical protein [Candidatus Bathyarchaeota archaeon]